MTTARIVAASLALAATAAVSSLALAATAGHGEAAYPRGVGRIDRGAGPAGRSSFRDDSHSHFQSAAGDWGFARHGGWRRGGGFHHRAYGRVYPYGADGFYDGDAGYGPSAFGPEPPYESGFGYPPVARPMAPALAPLAYGPGVHDGAYAYGYDGYAQTPQLDIGYGPPGWAGVAVGRPCGC